MIQMMMIDRDNRIFRRARDGRTRRYREDRRVLRTPTLVKMLFGQADPAREVWGGGDFVPEPRAGVFQGGGGAAVGRALGGGGGDAGGGGGGGDAAGAGAGAGAAAGENAQ